MYIEDIIQKLYFSSINLNIFDSKIIASLYSQLCMGTNFTEKQANLAVSVLKKYKSKISLILNQNISTFLDNPQFRHKFRNINTSKTIEIIDHAEFKKAIRVSFPYDDSLISKFKKEKSNFHYATWSPDEKAWIFSLHEKNILFLSSLIDEFNFVADEEFVSYSEQIKQINQHVENHIPMLVKDRDNYVLKNVHPTIQGILGNNLIVSLFEARKRGIFVWDDTIDYELDMCCEDLVVKRFLKCQNTNDFMVNLEESTLSSVSTIVKNLLPCLIIIPGGSELEILEKNFDLLKHIGIDSQHISVMFRLSNETNKEFNDFVKKNSLNNPIDTNTKIVFVSNNIPKPLLESRINFESVLNYNFYSPHYKLRDFIINHHNVINIVENAQQRRLNFGIM